MSFWSDSGALLFQGQAIDFSRRSGPLLDSDDYSLRHLPHLEPVVGSGDASGLVVLEEPGLQGPLDGLLDDLQASSRRSVASALAFEDARLASDDPSQVALGVLGKTSDLVEEAGRDALFGVAGALLHPLDTAVHAAGLLASPQEAVATWWRGTDLAHKVQDVLGVGLLAGLGRAMTPSPAAAGSDLAPMLGHTGETAASVDAVVAGAGGGEAALGQLLGGGLVAPTSSTRLARDFSRHMPVAADGSIDYWGPKALGVDDQFLHSTLDAGTGELRLSLQRSADPAAAARLGWGDEMFSSMMTSYRQQGIDVQAIVGRWSKVDGLNSNIDRFLAGVDAGLTPERAAFDTFTGQQAQSFGFTRVVVPGDEATWRGLGAQPRFMKPDWGADAGWNDYANAWVSSMARR